jgi:hypothetical protein
VPVEMPDGVDYEHIFGEQGPAKQFGGLTMYSKLQNAPNVLVHNGSVGVGAGAAGGIGAGSYRTSAPMSIPAPLSSPPPPGTMQAVRVEAASEPIKVEPKPTGERAVLESKLHPMLMKAYDCWQRSGDQCSMLHNGKLNVQIFLAGTSADTIAQLRAMGFESTTKNSFAKVLVGNLPAEKLPALVRMAAVQFVSPVKT